MLSVQLPVGVKRAASSQSWQRAASWDLCVDSCGVVLKRKRTCLHVYLAMGQKACKSTQMSPTYLPNRYSYWKPLPWGHSHFPQAMYHSDAPARLTPMLGSCAGNAPGSVEEWDRWAEAYRAGVRQPLGVDYQGRAYWALGSRAGAWRIYVEEPTDDPACSLWGYYEGARIESFLYLKANTFSMSGEFLRDMRSRIIFLKETTCTALQLAF